MVFQIKKDECLCNFIISNHKYNPEFGLKKLLLECQNKCEIYCFVKYKNKSKKKSYIVDNINNTNKFNKYLNRKEALIKACELYNIQKYKECFFMIKYFIQT